MAARLSCCTLCNGQATAAGVALPADAQTRVPPPDMRLDWDPQAAALAEDWHNFEDEGVHAFCSLLRIDIKSECTAAPICCLSNCRCLLICALMDLLQVATWGLVWGSACCSSTSRLLCSCHCTLS